MFSQKRNRLHGAVLLALCFTTALLWVAVRRYTTTDDSFSNVVPTVPIPESPQLDIEATAFEAPGNRPLITYVYSESEESRRNFQFFIKHGIYSRADFLFIFNGDTDAHLLLPDEPWVRSIRRNNTCYDLGSHAEVLLADGLWKRYKRFILMNASVRGPFMPSWANNECWSERLLSRVTPDVKLVGVALNCWPTPHVQSMVWATDSEGLGLLLHPPATSPRHDQWMEVLFSHAEDFPRPADYKTEDPDWVENGLSQCFENRFRAVEAEIAATGIILGAGKKVDVLLSKYQTSLDHNATRFCEPLGAWDPQGEGAYDGASIHPYETIFIKTNRGISPKTLENLSRWTDEMAYSSHDHC